MLPAGLSLCARVRARASAPSALARRRGVCLPPRVPGTWLVLVEWKQVGTYSRVSGGQWLGGVASSFGLGQGGQQAGRVVCGRTCDGLPMRWHGEGSGGPVARGKSGSRDATPGNPENEPHPPVQAWGPQ